MLFSILCVCYVLTVLWPAWWWDPNTAYREREISCISADATFEVGQTLKSALTPRHCVNCVRQVICVTSTLSCTNCVRLLTETLRLSWRCDCQVVSEKTLKSSQVECVILSIMWQKLSYTDCKAVEKMTDNSAKLRMINNSAKLRTIDIVPSWEWLTTIGVALKWSGKRVSAHACCHALYIL